MQKVGLTQEGIKSGVAGFSLGSLLGALIIVLCTRKQDKCTPGCREPAFRSVVERNLIARDRESHSKTIDISRVRNFSFLARNDGPYSAVVQPELSPDGITWGSFGELPYIIKPGESHLFVPQYFLRYARLKFRSKRPGLDTFLTVWFQGQS